ncbi:PHF7 protein, partial [Glaucidium brasilianum]|nr:PHF7 protein [Glaucidium brasilianum]
CFVCRETGAAITCCQEGCDRSFHLPCAIQGQCITQYFSPYRSFCSEHRPEQEVEAAPDNDSTCIICLDPVDDTKSYHTMVCPVCKHAWFHRGCIQRQAWYTVLGSFKCPLCRDNSDFVRDMFTTGIQVPLRLPPQKNEAADEALIQRHSLCDACQCLCHGGREHTEEWGPWELLLCSTCAAEGTHHLCSKLSASRTSWECQSC